MPKEALQELTDLSNECMRKAGLTELSEKLQGLKWGKWKEILNYVKTGSRKRGWCILLSASVTMAAWIFLLKGADNNFISICHKVRCLTCLVNSIIRFHHRGVTYYLKRLKLVRQLLWLSIKWSDCLSCQFDPDEDKIGALSIRTIQVIILHQSKIPCF